MARDPVKRKAWQKQYNEKTKERKREWNREAYDRRRAIVDAFKSAPCMDCGKTYPPCVMDFDHVRGNKIGNIATMIRQSIDVVIEEIEKCDIVCSNCHRIRTHERRTDRKTRRNSFECSPI